MKSVNSSITKNLTDFIIKICQQITYLGLKELHMKSVNSLITKNLTDLIIKICQQITITYLAACHGHKQRVKIVVVAHLLLY